MPHARSIDTHAHIIDPRRFPFDSGPGYKPSPGETGTAEDYCAVLDAHGVSHALLIQPSGYGYDNTAILDAMVRFPGRFKAIAVVDPETPEKELRALAERGVVGVRFNLVSYRADALDGKAGERYLARLRDLGWFAQVFADDAQWPEVAALLRRSSVKVLVDHFGVRDLARGTHQPGFAAVLALGRDGNAAVKLSAPFRVSRQPADLADLDPYAAALLAAFGSDGCIWGSDWPFLGLPGGYRYDTARRAVERWLVEPTRRDAVLWSNAARLFGFGGQS